VQAERVPVEGAVDVFAASAAGVAADFPQAELLIYPELYLCGLNGRAEERVPGSKARWPSQVQATAARTGRSSVARAGRCSVANGAGWAGSESLGAEPSGK